MTTANLIVTASADDARETDGTVVLTDANIGLTAGSYYYGARFLAAPMAQGATISAATLTYNIVTTTYDSPNGATVVGELVSNAAVFTTDANNVSNRYVNTPTTAIVTWAGIDIGAGDKTLDVTAIVQEIVNQAGWAAGNALALVIRALGGGATSLNLKAYDGSTTLCPRLDITYTNPSGGGGAQVAFIGRGVTIIGAGQAGIIGGF